MRLNSAGQVIEKYWEGLPDRFPGVSIDARAFMPNHIHGIVILVGAQFIAPSDDDLLEGRKNKGAMNRAPTLGEIVRSFKASTTRQLRLTQLPEFGWQRNYLEHVIRDDDSLNRIREYIGTNALRWDMDRENPYRLGEDPFDRWLASFTEGPDKRWRM